MNTERIKHSLTLYHLRDNRKSNYRIAICSCGWRGGVFNKVKWHVRWRFFSRLCWIRGHNWKTEESFEVGPAGAPDEEFEKISDLRQCERCYKAELI
jgi:hypothetical protein